MLFSAYFVVPYRHVCFVQFLSGVSLLIYFLCLFGTDELYIHVTVHGSLEAVIKNLHESYQCRMYSRKLLMMGRDDGRNM
jgi:hypothetical protein